MPKPDVQSKLVAEELFRSNWPASPQEIQTRLDLYARRKVVNQPEMRFQSYGQFSHRDLVILCVFADLVPACVIGKSGITFDVGYKERPGLERFFEKNKNIIVRKARKEIESSLGRKRN